MKLDIKNQLKGNVKRGFLSMCVSFGYMHYNKKIAQLDDKCNFKTKMAQKVHNFGGNYGLGTLDMIQSFEL